MDYGKILRTAQSYMPALKPAKDTFYRYARRLFRIPHESDFRILSRLHRDDDEVLVDIGANHGQSIESMRLFQPAAPIVAFEANPHLTATLAHRYAGRTDVRIEACGLGETAGAFTLHVPSYRGFVYDGLGSVDRDEAMSWLGPKTLFGFDASKLTLTPLRCRIAALDSFALAPAFIKIDVQGLEYAVLLGARATIARQRPALLIEDADADPRIVTLLKSMGYGTFHVADGRAVEGFGPGPNTLFLPGDRARIAP